MSRRYNGPIIDAHQHFWDLAMMRHPWLNAAKNGWGGVGNVGPLQKNYLPADYSNDSCAHQIVATVHVEANWRADDCVGETRWLNSLERPPGIAERYVVHVPLGDPKATQLLDEQASHKRVVGVRDILSWDQDLDRRFAKRDGIMDESAWKAGLKALKSCDLVFDLMVFSRQLPQAARLAAAFPDQQFVLNHCGSPIDRDAEGMQAWRDSLKLLAECPNVAIKISDLVAYDHNWTLESLRPIVMHCIECFGPQRSMFASDFPVAGLHATFDQVYGSFKTITKDFSPDEQTHLFFETAKRIYRLHNVALTT